MRSTRERRLVVVSLAVGVGLGLAAWLPYTAFRSGPHEAEAAVPVVENVELTAPVGDVCVGIECGMGGFIRWDIEMSEVLGDLVPSTTGRGVRVGDAVLARWSDGNWWEATVTAIDGMRITVAWRDGSAPVQLRDIHVAPLRKAPPMEVGYKVICKRHESTRWWRAVIRRGDNGLRVRYVDEVSVPFTGQCTPAIHGRSLVERWPS